jgi:endonuclease/exonuclease/phosphatase family metal-dependent hydrolase
VTPVGPGLRVVTYNVHRLRDDRAALVRTVRELAPDVVVVQEAPRRLWWRQADAAFAHACGAVVAAGGLPAAGNLILTDLRVRVVRTWWTRFPPTPGRQRRAAVFARCEVAGSPFLVVGAHLSTDPAERLRQARLLARAVSDPDAPVVLGVDVNDEPGSPTWQALLAGWQDAATTAGGAPATFPSRNPRRRIDAIAVHPAIRVEACRVLDGRAVRCASDHRPIVADLRLPVCRGRVDTDRAGQE